MTLNSIQVNKVSNIFDYANFCLHITCNLKQKVIRMFLKP